MLNKGDIIAEFYNGRINRKLIVTRVTNKYAFSGLMRFNRFVLRRLDPHSSIYTYELWQDEFEQDLEKAKIIRQIRDIDLWDAHIDILRQLIT